MTRREFAASLARLLAGAGTLAGIVPAQGQSKVILEQRPARIRGLKGPFRVIDVNDHTLNTSVPNLSEAALKYYPPDATI